MFSNKHPGFCVIGKIFNPAFQMLRICLILILFINLIFSAFSQEHELHVVPSMIIGQDTLPYIQLDVIEIFDVKIFKNNRQASQNTRLIKNVKIVYPYARLAGKTLKEYEIILGQVDNERERRKILKELENEINDKYGDELKKLTFSQGKILIKLIDRETGNTSFDLVKDLRGNFLAFFYQSFARVFGYNLKVEYDPDGEDRNIEIIVRMIENGVI
jgi:hypothetical protein